MNVNSIYLFSELNRKCIELRSPKIRPEDLLSLQFFLPRNLKGVSFYKPVFRDFDSEKGEVFFHSESRQEYVSRYMLEVAEKLLEAGEALSALRFLELAKRVFPKQPLQFELLRARGAILIGRIEEAKKSIEKFLQKESNNPIAWFLKGKIAFSHYDYAAAGQAFEKASLVVPSGHSWKETIHFYNEFNQIYLLRDQLYAKKLSSEELIESIRHLISKVQELKEKISIQKENFEIRGMEIYLDNLEKLFFRWIEELQSQSL